MALKRQITKAEFDALDAILQKEYKAEGADFVLDASGFDDPVELKRAKDRESQGRRDAEAEAARLKTELATITNTDARRAGDVEALEKSWKTKMDDAVNAAKAETKKKDQFIAKTLVTNTARALAAELGGDNSELLLPHIERRLTLDTSGEEPITRVLDKDGKPSAFSVEDLKKEITNDTRYAPLVIASKASGGGAAGGNRPGNNGGAAAPGGPKKLKEMGDQERKDFFARDPKGFEEAVKADRRVI